MAEDALDLLDSLGIEKAFVFGVSMGGMIALELARIASSRIKAMLLGCTSAGGKTRVSMSPETASLLLADDGLSREEIFRKQIPLFFSEKFQAENFDVIDEYIRSQLKAPAQPRFAFLAQLKATGPFDCTDALEHIPTPSLVVTGAADVLIPAANSTYLAEHLPNSELILIPGAGHALQVECRDFLNQATHSFYQKHSGD
jgi:pimeloyl-ACP methyl ester carboxylesterase